MVIEASAEHARQAFVLFDGLLNAVAGDAASYPEKQLDLLPRLIQAFRGIVSDYATQLRPSRRGEG